jgi:3,4-dihydroxy-2-butanone 4-phosphate synthase
VLGGATTTADDLLRPGHVFPLIAKKGLLHERDGHTEVSAVVVVVVVVIVVEVVVVAVVVLVVVIVEERRRLCVAVRE